MQLCKRGCSWQMKSACVGEIWQYEAKRFEGILKGKCSCFPAGSSEVQLDGTGASESNQLSTNTRAFNQKGGSAWPRVGGGGLRSSERARVDEHAHTHTPGEQLSPEISHYQRSSHIPASTPLYSNYKSGSIMNKQTKLFFSGLIIPTFAPLVKENQLQIYKSCFFFLSCKHVVKWISSNSDSL